MSQLEVAKNACARGWAQGAGYSLGSLPASYPARQIVTRLTHKKLQQRISYLRKAMHIDFSRWRSKIGALQCSKQRWRNEHLDRGFDTRGSTVANYSKVPYMRPTELSIAMQNADMFQDSEKHQQ